MSLILILLFFLLLLSHLSIHAYLSSHKQTQPPKPVFNVTSICVPFLWINHYRFPSKVAINFSKLLIFFSFLTLGEKNICFIVLIEAAMILVQGTDGEVLTVVDVDCFHVEVLVWLFVYFYAFAKELAEDVRV